jgi:hypothetical protein
LLRNPWPKPTGVLEHSRKGETNDGSSFFGTFLCDRIPTTTKDVNVSFFINNSNSFKLLQRTPELFETNKYSCCYNILIS